MSDATRNPYAGSPFNTVRYSTLKEALYETVHHGNTPMKAMAEELGCSYSTLANSVNPNIPELEFQLGRFIPTLRLSQNFAALYHICHAVDHIALPLPTAPKCLEALNKELLKTIKEFSDLTQAASQRLADGHASHKDAAAIEKEGMDLVRQTMAYIHSVRCAADNGGKLP
ncbi:MAG: hypothetical protein OEV73_00290 [Desulfobulbaceae bacterium]|nr:hypothetical protein [Desulfobulbaceae bacterium]